MVKDLWHVSMERDGQQSVYYDGVQLERLPVAEVKPRIREWQEKPHYKMYPTLARQGNLSMLVDPDERGLRLLVKQALISSITAYDIMPSMKPWLKRNKLWSEPKKEEPIVGEVVLNETPYRRVNGHWCFHDTQEWVPLPDKAHFSSVWECRVKFALGQITLHRVAEYGWGPLLEVVGDIIFRAGTSSESDVAKVKEDLTREIQEIQAERQILTGFTQKGELWVKRFQVNPLNPIKKKLFWDLFEEVTELRMSGRAARLRLINDYPLAIQWEDRRWKHSKTLYCPVLIGRQAKLDACRTLAEARDIAQRIFLEVRAVGLYGPELDKIYFYYKRNRFGLWLESGKIFLFNPNNCKFIPKDFDKWDEDKKRYYLGADYETQVEKWNKQSRLARRLYFYLKHEGVSCRKAWLIAQYKYQKLAASYVRRIRASGKWACYNANLTAKTSAEVLGGACA